MNLDWSRLRAVVLASDDWGLCAWSPDEQAYRVLSDSPAFRSPAGRRYGGSTLESAVDVRSLTQMLAELRGGDGLPPVWQANTVMAAPDYARLRPPMFETDALPLIDFPETPPRWQRPGLWKEIERARAEGLWWPELHGLHHLPEHAWLQALRRGEVDARRAHEHQSPICSAVEASGEYAPSEPYETRMRNLGWAIERFTSLFGRSPGSLCPPDYRWDEALEARAAQLGVSTFQGKGEQVGPPFPKLRRLVWRYRWRHQEGARFYLPPRIAFEPCGVSLRPPRAAVGDAVRRVRGAWSRGQPAALSSHRANYAHLDPEWSASGRAALRELLKRLAADGAIFLTDVEVRQLHERGWSVRLVGRHGAVLRYHGVPREPIRFPVPVDEAPVRMAHGPGDAEAWISGGELQARLNAGAYRLDWSRA